MGHDPDAELIGRIARGEPRAAERFVHAHARRLVRLAQRMLNDAAEAEDVAQEVFVRVWKEAPRWTPGGAKFQTWMHRVALNLCYDRLRRRREQPDAEAGLTLADPAASPGDVWLAEQRAARVRAALQQLPERQRAAIALCHFEELSNIDAAAALEVSVEALESLLGRGRRALKAMLADVASDMGDLGDVRRE